MKIPNWGCLKVVVLRSYIRSVVMNHIVLRVSVLKTGGHLQAQVGLYLRSTLGCHLWNASCGSRCLLLQLTTCCRSFHSIIRRLAVDDCEI